MFAATTIAIVIVFIYLLSSIKILAEHERGLIFRLGRMLEQARGPGIVLVFAPLDRMVRVSLRKEALKPPAQDVMAREAATSLVDWIGVTQTPLSPAGKALVHGELWDAVSPVNLASGQHVIVRQVDGLMLRVEPVALPAMTNP